MECQYIQLHIYGMGQLDLQTQYFLGIYLHTNLYCSSRKWEWEKLNIWQHMYDWLVHLHINHKWHGHNCKHIILLEYNQTLKD
jgi:hypothetical protein